MNNIEEKFYLVKQLNSYSIEDTKSIGLELSADLIPGQVVGFIGELGAGKTELIRAICGAYGDSSLVSSPTYVLENEYKLPNGMSISHWDLYRIQADIGDTRIEINELKKHKKSLVLVEWPSPIMDLLDLVVLVSFADSEARIISVYSKKN